MKKWVEQEIVNRACEKYDEGEMGFHDYVTRWEDYNTFVCRVSQIANDMMDNGELLNIAYPNENIAIIIYIKSKE